MRRGATAAEAAWPRTVQGSEGPELAGPRIGRGSKRGWRYVGVVKHIRNQFRFNTFKLHNVIALGVYNSSSFLALFPIDSRVLSKKFSPSFLVDLVVLCTRTSSSRVNFCIALLLIGRGLASNLLIVVSVRSMLASEGNDNTTVRCCPHSCCRRERHLRSRCDDAPRNSLHTSGKPSSILNPRCAGLHARDSWYVR